MGVYAEVHKNHAAINTLIMTIKKRICYMERLKSHDPNTIKSLIESRIRVEKIRRKEIRKKQQVNGTLYRSLNHLQEYPEPQTKKNQEKNSYTISSQFL